MESEGNTDNILDNQKTNSKVTSVGNAWVISRSKSYSGRVYYFNTLTGEAVWNLSKEEIEKAKNKTAKLPSQSENFPEPQEPPGDHSKHDSYLDNNQPHQILQCATPNLYNKQITNNQYTRAQLQPFMTPCLNCSPINSNPSMVGIRPNMWIQPPPIFLNSSGTSMTNINQIENVSQHNSFNQDLTVQNTSVSLSRRFSFANTRPCGKNFNFRPHGVGKFTPWKTTFNTNRIRRQQNNNRISDLRSIITGKKTVNDNLIEGQGSNLNSVKDNDNSIKTSPQSFTSAPQHESKTVEDDLNVNADEEWLKNNGIIHEGKVKLDVTILKNLATEDSDCDCWYIVVDINVLMEHFNILNVLTTSDPQCRLMVARGVLAALQAAGRARAGARAALRALSRMFAARVAVIAEYSFEPNEIKNCTHMINFCSMLQKQNEHLILLTNEEGSDKKTSLVPIFTIQDLKELLTSDKNKEVKITNPIIERNIEITIPNDIQSCEHSVSNEEETVIFTSENHTASDCSSKAMNTETNIKETIVQTDEFIPPVRKMVDAEVQTDPSIQIIQPTTQKDSVGVNTVENSTEVRYVDRETNVDRCKNNAAIIQENNTREIRLKRSISNLTTKSNSNDAQKMHFKWHRKRRDALVASSDSSSLDERGSRMSTFSDINVPQIPNAQDAMSQAQCQSTQMYYADIGEGSENSSCVFMQREANENILIEETSTSDVISNSVSVVDSVSVQDMNRAKENNTKNDDVKCKNVMFEITSEEMEQNLRMRRDEWLADFTQIMEEVLTQVLQRKSEDIIKAMPPPWTLHEATECIKRTFLGDCDVFDAATKLSQHLHTMSDIKGKIKVDFNPNEFMELYSYGVYLVDSLQCTLDKCEDVQIATESLAKLLKHIETPIAEAGLNDSFDTTDLSVVVSQSSTEVAASQEICSAVSNKSSNSRKPQKSNNQSSRKYNLKSSWKTKTNEGNVESPPVKFIRKIDIYDDFFTSLHLKRNETAVETANVVGENPSSTQNSVSEKSPTADKGPSIVRNFSKCAEFEEKLKKQSEEPLDGLHYSTDYNDYDDMEDYSDECDKDQQYLTEYKVDYPESNQLDYTEIPANDSNNNYFKVIVASLMEEMKEITANVYTFCKNTHDEIQSKNMHTGRSIVIHDKAQKTNKHIQKICNSFQRIQRNINQNGDGFRSRLKEAGILLHDREVNMYRSMIGSCIEQGDTLLESINIIIDAVKP